jgi:SAM-dependent methyltransferase
VSAQFDEYRETYGEAVEQAISFVKADLDFFTHVKADVLLDLCRRRIGNPPDLSALDVGCGPGETDAYLAPAVGDLHGIDVSEGVLETARKRNPSVTYASYDGGRFPFADGRFDLVFAICVLHHVPPDRWPAFTGEMARVVRPGGVVAVIEHNPFNPLTRLAVHRCEFDDEAVLLTRRSVERLQRQAGLEPVESRYILFFPWRGERLRRTEAYLQAVPLGAQHLAAAARP